MTDTDWGLTKTIDSVQLSLRILPHWESLGVALPAKRTEARWSRGRDRGRAGVFSEHLLGHWLGHRLHSTDP